MDSLNKINEYLLKKKEQFIIDTNGDDILSAKVNPNIVLGMLANLDQWGYAIDPNMVRSLFQLSENTFVHNFYEPLIETLKEIKGDDVSHDNFLFKNFPDSCRSLDLEELSDMRFLSYYTGVLDFMFEKNVTHEIEWDGDKEERENKSKVDVSRIRTIKEGTVGNFENMVKNLLSSRAALSPFDKEIVEFALKSDDIDNKRIIPDEIPFKENWAYLFKFAFDNPDLNINMEFKNFNDFIRATVALSDGDVSLSEKPHLRAFKNQERIRLLKMLEEGTKKHRNEMEQSLLTKRNRRFLYNVLQKGWHIDQPYFSKKIPEFYRIAHIAEAQYSNRAIFEMMLKERDFELAAEVLCLMAPGEVARKTNLLLTECDEKDEHKILNMLKPSLVKAPIPILLNLKNTVVNTNYSDIKVAFPKGQTAYAHAFENNRNNGSMFESTKSELISTIDDAIKNQLQGNSKLGKVYIDESLKNCPVPFSSRNESGENRSAERGTSFPITKEARAIRAFCYKKISKNPEFVDLSATFLNKNFDMVDQCSWTSLQSGNSNLAVHSGDNPNCRYGLTEFIDIDLQELEKLAKEKDIRYVAFHVLSYGHVPFKNMDRCFFGIMEREKVASDLVKEEDMQKLKDAGVNTALINYQHSPYYFQLSKEQKEIIGYKQEKTFDPATVEYRNDIKTDGVANIPMIYDVKERKMIIADLETRGSSPFIKASVNAKGNVTPLQGTMTVENLQGATAQACYAVVNMDRPNMYDLAMYNLEARNGELTDDISEADTIFVVTKDNLGDIKENAEVISVYDRDVITSDLMMTNVMREERQKEIAM